MGVSSAAENSTRRASGHSFATPSSQGSVERSAIGRVRAFSTGYNDFEVDFLHVEYAGGRMNTLVYSYLACLMNTSGHSFATPSSQGSVERCAIGRVRAFSTGYNDFEVFLHVEYVSIFIFSLFDEYFGPFFCELIIAGLGGDVRKLAFTRNVATTHIVCRKAYENGVNPND